MHHVMKFQPSVFLIIVSLALTGCLDIEKTDVVIDVNTNLSGSVMYNFSNIHSTEKNGEEKKAEMARFYEEEPGQTMRNFSKYGFTDVKARLFNQTPLRCDATLSAKFRHLTSSLFTLEFVDKHRNYQISRQGTRLKMRFWTNIGFDNNTLTIRYEGKVISHNADSYDKQTRHLVWKPGKKSNGKDERQIYFTLSLK